MQVQSSLSNSPDFATPSRHALPNQCGGALAASRNEGHSERLSHERPQQQPTSIRRCQLTGRSSLPRR